VIGHISKSVEHNRFIQFDMCALFNSLDFLFQSQHCQLYLSWQPLI